MSRIQQNAPVDPFAELANPETAFTEPVQLRWLRQLLEVLRKLLQFAVLSNKGVPQILLNAPDGTAWAVRVANDGTLSTVNARSEIV